MLVVQKEIRSRNLVSPETQIFLKNSTCDLTIGEIFPMGEDRAKQDTGLNQFVLEPSHMITVLTSQRLTLPADVTGLATLGTTLTQEGILCLNTGIVDPGYDGHLSATLVNFSKIPRIIKLDDRLFRVIFLPHKELSDDEFEPFINTKSEYRGKIIGKASQEFSETFLNVRWILNIARSKAWNIVLTSILTNWLPWIAIAISLVALFFQIYSE